MSTRDCAIVHLAIRIRSNCEPNRQEDIVLQFFTMKFVPLATSLILSSSLLTLARADGTAVVTEPLAADVVDASTSLEVDDATCAYVLTISFKHSDAYPLPPGPEGTSVTGTFMYENKEYTMQNKFLLIVSSLPYLSLPRSVQSGGRPDR